MNKRCADVSPCRSMWSNTSWWSAAARLRQSRTCSRVSLLCLLTLAALHFVGRRQASRLAG
ncbi:hypothetical protein ACWD62_36545 [Streptomyces sp. NPDC005146]